jgi:hypothetical protein
MKKLLFGCLVVLALPFAVARADRPHHPPPQAAFDACAKAKAGDACSMTLHDHPVAGVCIQPPDTSALACRPDHPPWPPPEAIAACDGRNAGDACSVVHGEHTLAGTCAHGHDGRGPLACRPSDAPPPPR